MSRAWSINYRCASSLADGGREGGRDFGSLRDGETEPVFLCGRGWAGFTFAARNQANTHVYCSCPRNGYQHTVSSQSEGWKRACRLLAVPPTVLLSDKSCLSAVVVHISHGAGDGTAVSSLRQEVARCSGRSTSTCTHTLVLPVS